MTKSFLSFAVLALALFTFAGLGHAATCEDLLGNNVYRCEGIGEGSFEPFDECFRFNSTAPTVSDKFDLTVDGLGGETLACSCKATGKVTNPAWDQSKEWVCITSPSSSEGSYTWGGKVGGKGKISKVYAVDSSGGTYIFSCVVDPACVYPGPIANTLTVYDAERR